MNFRMLMANKKFLSYIFLLYFHFLYKHERKPGIKGRKQRLGLAGKLNSTSNALVVKDWSLFKCCLFYAVHENAVAKNGNIHF